MRRPYINVLPLIMMLGVGACAPAAEEPAGPAAPTIATEAPAPTATAEPVHLKAGMIALMTGAPLYVAAQEGYFADHGLDVELTLFSTASAAEMVPALIAEDIDVLGSSIGAAYLNAIAQGGEFRAVADKGFLNPDSCASEAFVARKGLLDAGIFDDPAAFRGMTIVSRPGAHEEMLGQRLLAPAGLTLADVQVEPVLDFAVRLESLGNGSLDVAALTEPWITRARNAGVADVLKPWADLLPGFSIGYVWYGPGMLKQDHDVRVRFMLGYLEGVRQYREGPTERNVEILAEFTGLEPAEVKEMCWPSFQPDGKVDLDALGAYEEWAFESGYLDARVPLDQIFDPQYVEEASTLLTP